MGTQCDVLLSLYDAVLVRPTFSLYWDYELPTMLVQPDIDFINFDLPYAFDCCSQVILKRVGRNTKKNIYETVVADLGQ